MKVSLKFQKKMWNDNEHEKRPIKKHEEKIIDWM